MWLRCMRGRRGALRQASMVADEFGDALRIKQRVAIPPDPWDDIQISYTRGQAWARK